MTGVFAVAKRRTDARKGDQPPEDEGGTRQVRVAGDLADMLGEIHDVTGEPTAQFLDPLIRASIEAEHVRLLPVIAAMKKARKRGRPQPE